MHSARCVTSTAYEPAPTLTVFATQTDGDAAQLSHGENPRALWLSPPSPKSLPRYVSR